MKYIKEINNDNIITTLTLDDGREFSMTMRDCTRDEIGSMRSIGMCIELQLEEIGAMGLGLEEDQFDALIEALESDDEYDMRNIFNEIRDFCHEG